MGRFFLRWVLLVVALLVSAGLTNMLLPGKFLVKVGSVSDFLILMVAVAVLTVLNATLGVVIKLLTLPLNCLTLGLVSLLVNALMLLIVGTLGLGLHVDGFMAAFIGSLLLSAANAVLGALVPDKNDKE